MLVVFAYQELPSKDVIVPITAARTAVKVWVSKRKRKVNWIKKSFIESFSMGEKF